MHFSGNVVEALSVPIRADANPDSLPVIVDLEACTVRGPGTGSPIIAFDIDPERRETLIEGLDEIGITLKHEAQIAAFQVHDAAQRPWVYRNAFLT